MRRSLILSLILNSILAGCIGFMMLRLGGWKYAFYRFMHDESGLYEHRVGQFSTLPPQPGAIVFLGDSQIEQCEWAEWLGKRDAPIINRGIVGDHVDGVYKRLSEIARHKPSKVFLCVGVNDILLNKPFPDIERRYRDIVRKLRMDNPQTSIVLISLLPINNNVKRIGISNEDIREVNARLQQIARDNSLPYLDLFKEMLDGRGDLAERFTKDGIHLNAQGYMEFRKALEPYLKNK